MRWLNKLKSKVAIHRAEEEQLYEAAFKEVDYGVRRDGLWAKAVSKSNGAEERTKSIYIELLVQKYRDESHLRAEFIREIVNEQIKEQQDSVRTETQLKEDENVSERVKLSKERYSSKQDSEVLDSAGGGGKVFWFFIAFLVLMVFAGVMYS